MSRSSITLAALAAALALSLGPARADEATPPSAPAAPAAATTPGTTQGGPVTVPVAGQLALTTDDQKTLYALGLALSQNLGRLRLSAGELAYVIAGLEDGVLAAPPRVALDEFSARVQLLAQERFAATASEEQAAAETFVSEMAASAGAVRTDSGLVFIDQREGSGPSPVASDVVRVHYHGTLPGGEVFDSSRERGEPATFPLDQVIPCWTEALQRMKVGGTARIVCPPGLAYGAQGRPGIPPNAALVFDVELLGIGEQQPAGPAGQTSRGEPLLQQLAP